MPRLRRIAKVQSVRASAPEAGKLLMAWLVERYELEGCLPLIEQLCAVADRIEEVRRAMAAKTEPDGRLISAEVKLLSMYGRLWKVAGLSEEPKQAWRGPGAPTLSEKAAKWAK